MKEGILCKVDSIFFICVILIRSIGETIEQKSPSFILFLSGNFFSESFITFLLNKKTGDHYTV